MGCTSDECDYLESFCPYDYAKDRLSDKERPVGKLEREVYIRFMRDYEEQKNNKKSKWVYSADEVKRRMWFALKAIPIVTEASVRPFKFLRWQLFILSNIYGWLRRSTAHERYPRRRYTDVYIEIGKKNGKTTFIAALCLLHMHLDLQAKGEVYINATGKEQATICHKIMSQMVKQSPPLQACCRVMRDEIRFVHPQTKESGIVKPVPYSPSGTDGLEPSLVIQDEMHEMPTLLQFRQMKLGMGARRNPLSIAISTAGLSSAVPAKQYREDIRDDILSMNKEGFSWKESNMGEKSFAIIFALDDEDDWKDSSLWQKANPSLGESGSITLDYLITQYKQLDKNNDEDVAVFRAKQLGLWHDGASVGFVSRGQWNACTFKGDFAKHIKENSRNMIVCMGLDLSSKDDFTALATMFIDSSGASNMFYTKLHIFTTEQKVKSSEYDVDSLNLKPYVDSGELHIAGEKFISHAIVLELIRNIVDEYGCAGLSYDPAMATLLANDIRASVIVSGDGEQSRVNTVSQVPWRSFRELENLIITQRIQHEGNAVMELVIENLRVKRRPSGVWLPVKGESGSKVDPIYALMYAVDAAIRLGQGIFNQEIEEHFKTMIPRIV